MDLTVDVSDPVFYELLAILFFSLSLWFGHSVQIGADDIIDWGFNLFGLAGRRGAWTLNGGQRLIGVLNFCA